MVATRYAVQKFLDKIYKHIDMVTLYAIPLWAPPIVVIWAAQV